MTREKELLKLLPPKKDGVTLLDIPQKKPRPWYLLLCMLIPVVLFYLIYVAKGEHPFGDGCVLVLDLNAQYVWFFEALRNFVHGDAELLYSFSRALGGEFFGIYAYYLASPLSYLLCLFPQERMLEALMVMFLLKASLTGFTFGFYMHRTMKTPKPYAIVLFSTLYAMTSYAVVQQHNTMWIDAVIWLPIITLGIEELIKHGKFKLYTISLAITLFSNFYIGYMVCIYCFLYFFLYYIAHGGKEHRNNPHGEKSHFAKSLFRIAFYSMIALGIAASILLAAYYSLNFGKTTFSNPSWEWKTNFDILDLLYKFMPGSYDTVRPEGLPFVYCGVLTLLLLPAYFLSKKYPMRQKIVSAVFVLLFVASFTFSVTDLVWHVFQRPNWLNYRYSFMLCFYLCVLGCRAFADFEGVSLKTTLGTGGFIALICVILQKYQSGEYVDPNDYTTVWFTILAVGVYLVILAILRSATNKQVVSAVLIATVSIEVFLNGLWNLNAFGDDVGYSKYSYYNNFLNRTRPIVEQVQESDTSFYRMEKTFFRTTNDNMALNIRGLSGSTSTLNKETIHFLNKMGYASKSHWSKYLGGTPVNDSLLGIKYVISDNSIYSNYYESYKTDPVNKYTAYYNPYALSIAYGVDEDVLDFPLGFVSEISDETESKGKINELIATVKGKINEILNIDETVNSAEYRDDYNSPFERLNAMVSAMLGEEETLDIFVPVYVEQVGTRNLKKGLYVNHEGYKPIDGESDAVLSYTITMPEDAELYFYLPSGYPREVSMVLRNGDLVEKKGNFGGNETNRIISLGMQKADTELTLDMKLVGKDLYPMTDQECFYYIDWAVFEDAMARLAENQYQVTNHTESSFEGTYTASKENELVMTTLAYDKGWKVFVDGKEVETVKALGSLVSFHIEGDVGEVHDVKMVYSPETIGVGLTISFISLGILLLLILLERPFKKVPVLRALVSVPVSQDKQALTEYPLDSKTFRYAPGKERKSQNKDDANSR